MWCTVQRAVTVRSPHALYEQSTTLLNTPRNTKRVFLSRSRASSRALGLLRARGHTHDATPGPTDPLAARVDTRTVVRSDARRRCGASRPPVSSTSRKREEEPEPLVSTKSRKLCANNKGPRSTQAAGKTTGRVHRDIERRTRRGSRVYARVQELWLRASRRVASPLVVPP